MKRYLGISFVTFCSLILVTGLAAAKNTVPVRDLSPIEEQESSVVGDVDGTGAMPSKALQDTVWIADWNFDGGVGCTTTGWVQYDARIFNHGTNYWTINNSLADSFGISGNAVMLRGHDICWVGDGYPNDADYSIVLKYRGPNATLSFNYLSSTEPDYDYVTVEADSGGASESRVNYAVNPKLEPDDFRVELMQVDSLNMSSESFPLNGFGDPPGVTHEVYIRIFSDGGFSDQDGLYDWHPTQNGSRWKAGLVVDNIVVTGAIPYTENFEGALNPNVSLINSAPGNAFGIFARSFSHITDNDKCTEDPTCAWLVTDPLRIAFFPNMAFGPGSAVIRNWLDDIFVSPWVSLASTPSATGSVLSFRRFPGNIFANGRIVQGWRVRAKVRTNNTDTTSPTNDSIDCVSLWGHSQQFNLIDPMVWVTSIFDMTTNFSVLGKEIQVSFRTADWQHLTGIAPPAVLNPGPGPYTDRVRIGRRVLTGPVFNVGIDTRTQAQDCFPTFRNGILPGEHHSPDGSNIFGTCAFSEGTELGINSPLTTNLITGDSILINNIVDARGAGGVNLLKWYGAITAGPHAGKAPSPYTVLPSGFFEVQPDSCRNAGGSVAVGNFFVDLDDTYFRGGDQLKYFWYAGDAQGGRTSAPGGITQATGFPANVNQAEVLTVGMYEVNYLPTINWAPAYLARIAADTHGDLDPDGAELAASSQKNCILYYQHATANRRSGPLNRTSFMYTLDRLGYRGYYDVYDLQGFGNTNNQLGGRANVAQCTRYSLIIEDDQRGLSPNVTDGSNTDTEKVNQALWYRNYLGQGASGLAGVANLWIIGETTAFEKATNPLFSADMGLSNIVTDQGQNVNPTVTGLGSFTFTGGGVANFAGDVFSLAGGCPAIRNYDGATNAGTAVMTHRYTFGTATGPGAVIMNKNATFGWNTIWQGWGWFDIRNAFNTPPNSANGAPDVRLMRKILNAALPVNCVRGEQVTDNGGDPEINVPRVTSLYQNVPNPFNPTTTIKFDLARDGNVKLQVFDVAGHLVRTLANNKMNKGFNQAVTWNGLDEKGLRVPSGVYFYQLVTEDYTATKKMVMLK